MLVDLVDGRADGAEFDHLGTDVGDEPTIRGATGRRERWIRSGHLTQYIARDLDEAPSLGEERLAVAGPVDRVVECVLAQDRLEPLHQRFACARRRIAEVE